MKNKLKVAIIGESPFVEEVAELCLNAGHETETFWVEDLLSLVMDGRLTPNITQADIIIELHNESLTTKQELLYTLSNLASADALLLTSALSASTTQAASWFSDPQRVVGFGVLPPLTADGVVELARGIHTSDAALEKAQAFWQSIGQEPVLVGDGAGLVRARMVCCIINEAITALQANVASPADIDQAMRLGTNYPHGPLAWADHIGIDTVLGVMRGLYTEWQEDRYRPAPLLKRMVVAGQLGKKTQQGFYTYPASSQ